MLLGIAILLVSVLGSVHHFGLVLCRHVLPQAEGRNSLVPLGAFILTALLHMIHIAIGAALYQILQEHVFPGGLGTSFTDWVDYTYLSAIAFSTVGFGDLDVTGPMRLVVGAQSMAGFMIITWSATFIYDVSAKQLEKHR